MSKDFKNRLVGIVLVTTTSLLSFLVSAYFSSFATRAEVNILESKIDKIITGLCIIDSKTCILKER